MMDKLHTRKGSPDRKPRHARLLPLLLAAALLVGLAGCDSQQTTSPATDLPTDQTSDPATSPSSGPATGQASSQTSSPTVSPTASQTASTAPGQPTGPSSGTPSGGTSQQPATSGPRAAGPYRIANAYPDLTFREPLYFTTAGDGSTDAYVVERTGRIRVFPDRADAKESRVFLDLGSRIDLGGQEKGLLGLAFHPDYRNNGYFYVNYTTRQESVIARFTRPAGSAAADAGSGQVILSFPQPFSNHNGGHLAFGPDGFLYIASGDGGSSGDPNNNAQNRGNLLGKILRIDVDRPSDGRAYGIPADNPFAGAGQEARPEIYAYGLRNPWRFSFDADGTLWVADVGQSSREEIDLVEKGGNYGWAVMEGLQEYKSVPGVDRGGLKPPIWEYDRDQGKSVTGGYVYEGSLLPDLKGTYVYGDFVSGRIWALWREGGQVQNRLLLESGFSISSFGLDAEGELRIVDFRGGIHRFQPATG